MPKAFSQEGLTAMDATKKKAVVDLIGILLLDIYVFPGGQRNANFNFSKPEGNTMQSWTRMNLPKNH